MLSYDEGDKGCWTVAEELSFARERINRLLEEKTMIETLLIQKTAEANGAKAALEVLKRSMTRDMANGRIRRMVEAAFTAPKTPNGALTGGEAVQVESTVMQQTEE